MLMEMSQCGHNKFWALTTAASRQTYWPRKVGEDIGCLASQHEIQTVNTRRTAFLRPRCLVQGEQFSHRGREESFDHMFSSEHSILQACILLSWWIFSAYSARTPKTPNGRKVRSTANDWPQGLGQPQHKQQMACMPHTHTHTRTHALNKH